MSRTAGWLSIGSGVVFLVAVTYLFTVLTGAGLTLGMFDDTAALLPWIDSHLHAYQGLYLLYALSQMLLLPVPVLLWRAAPRSMWLGGAVWGTGAALLAMVGLAVAYGLAGPVSAAYTAAADDSARWAVVVTHGVTADIAKDVRLFSEVLLGGWLIVTGRLFARGFGPVLAMAGAWTVLVAGWKLFDPLMPLEDWLAFVVAATQIALGVALLRRTGPRPLGDHPARTSDLRSPQLSRSAPHDLNTSVDGDRLTNPAPPPSRHQSSTQREPHPSLLDKVERPTGRTTSAGTDE